LAVPGEAQVTMAGMDNLIGCGGNDLMLLSNMLDDTKLSEEKAEQERVRHLGPGDIGPPKQASPNQRLTPEAGRTLCLGDLLEGGAATGNPSQRPGIPPNELRDVALRTRSMQAAADAKPAKKDDPNAIWDEDEVAETSLLKDAKNTEKRPKQQPAISSPLTRSAWPDETGDPAHVQSPLVGVLHLKSVCGTGPSMTCGTGRRSPQTMRWARHGQSKTTHQ
jgi:hypothetical protein